MHLHQGNLYNLLDVNDIGATQFLLPHRRKLDVAFVHGDSGDGEAGEALAELGDGGQVDYGAAVRKGFDEAGGEASCSPSKGTFTLPA